MNNIFENTIEKVYVINLDKDTDRLEYVKNEFKKYNFNKLERIPGILGKELPDKDKYMKKLNSLGNNLHAAYGIAKSHISIYKKMLNENIKDALIVEDDIKLTPLIKHFKKIYDSLPEDWDIVWIGNSRSKWPKNTCSKIPNPEYELENLEEINNNVYKINIIDETENYPMGAYGYLINNKILKKLIDSYDFQRPIDTYLITNDFSNKYMVIPSMIIHCFDYGSYSSSIDIPRNKKIVKNYVDGCKYTFYAILILTFIYFYKYKNDKIKQYYYHLILILLIVVLVVEFIAYKCNKQSDSLTTDPFYFVWDNDKEAFNDVKLIINSFYELCEKHNIEYFPAFGTMLGLERNNGLIPWDDDVDVLVNKKEQEKLIKIIFPELEKKYNISFSKINSIKHADLKYKLFLSKNELIKKMYFYSIYNYSWPFVDIFFYDRNKNEIKFNESLKDIVYNLPEEFNLSYVEKEGLKFKSLSKKNTIHILNQEFKGWKNDCLSSNWDHKNETDKTVFKTDCKFLIL
jgi:glycosyl transferase, family 25